MAGGVGRRMQALLHGVMGLIGMGHLQVRKGDRKATEMERVKNKKEDKESVKEGEDARGREKGKMRNEFQRG